MNIFKAFLVIISIAGLSACGNFGAKKHEKDYLKNSEVTKPAVAPAGVPAIKQSPKFIAPASTITLNQVNVSLVPPGSKINQIRQNLAKK